MCGWAPWHSVKPGQVFAVGFGAMMRAAQNFESAYLQCGCRGTAGSLR